MDSSSIWQFIVLILCLLFSAFFSAAETSLVSLNKLRIRHMVEEKKKNAELVQKLVEDSNRLITTILIGNNIVNIGASALATSLMMNIFGNSGAAIATGLMTFLILVFGEITPKTVASHRAESIALKFSRPISWLLILFKPLVSVFNWMTKGIMGLLRINPDDHRPSITEEELRTVVNVSQEEGVLEIDEKEMIDNVFEFGERQIKDVMVQRTDIVAFEIDMTYEELIERIKKERFSRYPVIEEGMDQIVGILNLRDLFFVDRNREFCLKDYLRKPFYTFEFTKVPDLFKEMKKNKTHIAIVLDEYGGTAGLVTMEDLIEEIVGDIEDEYDEQEREIVVISEREYLINGSTKLEVVNEMLNLNLESENFGSIGGFIIGELGRLPEKGEVLNHEHLQLQVESLERNRIKLVRLKIGV